MQQRYPHECNRCQQGKLSSNFAGPEKEKGKLTQILLEPDDT